MMWWPLWIALTIAVIVLTAIARDRSAMVGAIIVLGGLIAMQTPWSPQIKFIAALTIWSVCCGLIVISTTPSILALLFAIIVAACYIPVVLGFEPLNWQKASDVAGVCLLLSLGGSGILAMVGGTSSDGGFAHFGPLSSTSKTIARSVARALSEAPPEALRDL